MQAYFATKAVYYGGYPGSSGKPVAGKLVWADGMLRFEPRGGDRSGLRIEQERLRAVRRDEEGMTGARRVRLLIDVESDQGKPATLKFEMGGIWQKGRKLQRWLDVLGSVCRERKDNDG